MAKITPVAAATEKPSFWSTLPGIFAGLAAVIGAVTALVVALTKEPEKPAMAAPAASAPMPVAPPDSASAAEAPIAPAPQVKPEPPAHSQTATADKGGQAVNISGSGNQVSVGK